MRRWDLFPGEHIATEIMSHSFLKRDHQILDLFRSDAAHSSLVAELGITCKCIQLRYGRNITFITVIAEKAGMDEISIKEFGTPSLTRIWLSSAPRISGAYAPGDSAAAGGARVDVLAVSPSAVSLRLTEENEIGRASCRERV